MINKARKSIIIIGGGFAGLNAALKLQKYNFNIILFDRRNFHLFQPLLYQVASGGLSPADIAFPLRAIFKNKKNISIIQSEITNIDLVNNKVTANSTDYIYDYLIIAAGAKNHYFGKNDWADYTIGLKSIEDATSIRNLILSSFEKAEIETDTDRKKALLTFAIIGGGPAGVELAGAIAELAKHTLHCDFRNIDPSTAKILLIEGGNRILPPYPENLSIKAAKSLEKLGVKILVNNFVTKIDEGTINLSSGENHSQIKANSIIWAAGVHAESLTDILYKNFNINLDKAGRIIVNEYCQIPQFKNVFAIGDISNFKDEKGLNLPGVAPVAMQQGKYVAKFIYNLTINKENKKFKYFDKGNLAVIGRKAAVAFRGNLKFSGTFAWLVWLFVHLLYLIGFENRFLVASQWAFNYFTLNRSARLIANNSKFL